MDKAKLERLELLEKAIKRLGKFGNKFVDYKGCPRGRRGPIGGLGDVSGGKHILLNEDPIVDVEGDAWIPVYAKDLYRYIDKHRWISVNERLPDLIPCDAGTAYSEEVNVLTSNRKVFTAIWDQHGMIADAEFWDAEEEEITHWTPVLLPLPQPDHRLEPDIGAMLDALEKCDLENLDDLYVRHGNWEPRKDAPGFVRCSICHNCNVYDDWPDGKKWNYCPNCGAKMDGGSTTGEEDKTCPT